jgi:hypothetical protein
MHISSADGGESGQKGKEYEHLRISSGLESGFALFVKE